MEKSVLDCGEMAAELDVRSAPIEWDKSQREVIETSAGDRLLVQAGPGTGKTAVACARVSKLIEQDGLEPGFVYLVSFSRIAVREIRDRIAACVKDTSAANAVQITTLDALAWKILKRFDPQAKITGNYDDTIRKALDVIQQNLTQQGESVADYFERSFEHLVVDEMQDIITDRAALVVEIINKLSSSCGVTVFADEAQAIYDDWASEGEVEAGKEKEPALSQKILDGAAGPFRNCELTEVHRTNSPQLLKIFSDTRRKVLTPAPAGDNWKKLAEIKTEITDLSHGWAPDVNEDAFAKLELEDAFILYRRRGDVLAAMMKLVQKGIPHRVQMSGLPVCLSPWIGAALSEHTDSVLKRKTFMELWADRVDGTSFATCEADDAWALLVRVVGGPTEAPVKMWNLRQCLGGSSQPPAELCDAAGGQHGPVVGTIHAAKGREADTVLLMLPAGKEKKDEARIWFVGATRARSRLLIGEADWQIVYRTRNPNLPRRTFSLKRDDLPCVRVEIGHDGDIGADGLAGCTFFADSDAVHASQARIRNLADETVSLVAESDSSAGSRYRLREDGQGQCLGVLSESVNEGLRWVAKKIKAEPGGDLRRLPDKIPHLHVRGVRTVVLYPDPSETEMLLEPWKTSGIMLAPVVLGYSELVFPV